MKLHKYSITGLFFFIFLFACHRDSDKTSLLHRADSLMQEFPDSALAILESIPHVEKLSGSNRADYAIFLTRARTKMYIHESSDSLIIKEVGMMSEKCRLIIIGAACIGICGVWI